MGERFLCAQNLTIQLVDEALALYVVDAVRGNRCLGSRPFSHTFF